MKKHAQLLMKIAIGLTILVGVLLILFANGHSFSKIVNDDIENISKLSSSIIYSEIDNSLTKPIYVALTMANDRFLKDWLADEATSGASGAAAQSMQQYLQDYCQKYGYDSVSVISNRSNTYYYQGGINKVISPSDAHDVWYYDFIASARDYDLDVDRDEVSGELTVFANCRITDADGKLLGVSAVGIQMHHLQALLQQYENEYDLRAFLIDRDGLVQIDSVAENIETANFFANPATQALQQQIIGNQDDLQTFWYPAGDTEQCLITKYVANLDWYIVVEKDTAQVQQVMRTQNNQDLLFIGLIIILVLVMISYVLAKYNRMLLKTASSDDVTGLPNAKMFQQIFLHNLKRPACRQGVLFLFDIDRFKDINDRFGHLFGNTVLYRISEIAKRSVGSKGLVARWGGDEFVGVIYGTPAEATQILQNLVEGIAALQEGELTGVNVSVGAALIKSTGNFDALLHEADQAMYRSKGEGRKKVTFF